MAAVKRVAFLPESTLTPAQQAVSLATSILRATRRTCWAELDGIIPTKVALHPGQLALLRDHLRVISYLSKAGTRPDGSKAATIGVAYCTHCQKWMLTCTDGSKKCPLTLGCLGQVVKVPAAPASAVPDVEDGQV